MRCRVNFRFYLLLLCAVYFTMLYIFHGNLQSQSKRSGRDKNSKTTLIHDGMLKIEPPFDIKRKVLASNQDFLNTSEKSSQTKHTLLRNGKRYENDDRNSTYQSTTKLSNCYLPASTPNRKFLSLESKSYVYSAYMDERYTERMVRIMVLLSNRNSKFYCHYRDATGFRKETASLYEMCENHGSRFGGYILSCHVEKGDICNISVSVRFQPVKDTDTAPNTSPVTVAVTQLSPPLQTSKITGRLVERTPYNFAVCVPPLFGYIDMTRFVEFIELNRILGFQHFIFYIKSMKTPDMSKVLDYYRDIGLVTTIDFTLPSHIQNRHIWYNGQLTAHNDCLYRAMSLTQYLAIIDLDEFIVPHNGQTTLEETIPKLFDENICGLSFDSAFYDQMFPQSKPESRLVTTRHTRRTTLFSKVRTKVLVKPSKVFEVGIHHISKPAHEEFKVKKVDTSVAYLHHYRQCVPNYGMKCNTFVEDDTMLNYTAKLESNVGNIFKNVFVNGGG